MIKFYNLQLTRICNTRDLRGYLFYVLSQLVPIYREICKKSKFPAKTGSVCFYNLYRRYACYGLLSLFARRRRQHTPPSLSF